MGHANSLYVYTFCKGVEHPCRPSITSVMRSAVSRPQKEPGNPAMLHSRCSERAAQSFRRSEDPRSLSCESDEQPTQRNFYVSQLPREPETESVSQRYLKPCRSRASIHDRLRESSTTALWS